jgi:hypothetical protein
MIKSPFLIIISTFRGVGSGSGEKFPDPDPAKRSGSPTLGIIIIFFASDLVPDSD